MSTLDEVRRKLSKLKDREKKSFSEKSRFDEAEALLYLATGRVVPQELTEAFDKNYFPVKNEVSKLTSDSDLEFSSMALSQYVLTKYPELEKPAKDFSQAIENLGSNIKGTDLRTIGKDIVLQHSLQNKDFDFETPLTKEQEKSFSDSLAHRQEKRRAEKYEEAEALLYLATGRVVPQELTEAFDKNYFPVKNEVSKLTSDSDLEFSSMALSQYVLTKYPELEKPAKDFSQAIENLGSNIKGTDLRTIGKDIVLQHSLQNKDFDFEAPLTKEQEKSFLNSLDAEQKNMQNYYILQQKGYNR